MNAQGQSILHHLEAVAAHRRLRADDHVLNGSVRTVKTFQHSRFSHTYGDLLKQPRYAKAARFFLDELYGPGDFAARDSQIARVVPGIVRVFPQEIVVTVAKLGELHALSESLDTEMGQRLSAPSLTLVEYGRVWRSVGRAPDRERQIMLMLAIGADLERYTGRVVLRHSLRLMRGPAGAAGLGALQRFLEAGFDTFRAIGGADHFLRTIAQREREFAADLFSNDWAGVRALPLGDSNAR